MIPVPPAVYRLLVAALLAGGLFCSGWWIGRDGAQDKAREAALLAEAKAEKVRQATEDGWRRAHWDLAYAAEIKRAEREQETDRTIADLRNGTLRLRDRFTCPSLPRPAEANPGDDAGSQGGLLREDAEFLLRLGSEADRAIIQLQECQAYVRTILGKE